MRADPLTDSFVPNGPPCSSTNTMKGNVKAIVNYDGSCSMPNSTAFAHDGLCEDEVLTNFVPHLALSPGSAVSTFQEKVVIQSMPDSTVYRWYLSGTTPGSNTFLSMYGEPTLQTVARNSSAYNGPLAVELPQKDQWVYIIIESPVPLPHPIHLHGHDFFVLGSAPYSTYTDQPLNLVNPPRRDVAVMPSLGYIVLGFITDNPGVWLMHCHIGWHVSMGFALQLVEQAPVAAQQLANSTMLNDQCTNYNIFAGPMYGNIVQDDSGV